MSKFFKAMLGTLFLLIFIPAQIAFASDNHREIYELYKNSEFQKAATLIEKLLADNSGQEQRNKSNKISKRELTKLKLILADIYGWHLDRADKAIKIYETEASDKQFVFLLRAADLYEQKGDNKSAIQKLNNFLEKSRTAIRETSDTEVRMMIGAINKYVKYRLDSLNLKIKTPDYHLLLKDLRLVELPVTNDPGGMMIYAFIGGMINPGGMETDLSKVNSPETLATYIKRSPKSYSQELASMSMIINMFQDYSESAAMTKAIRNFIEKFDGSLYPLTLLATLHKYYQDNSDKQNADIYLEMIRKITKSRGMKLAEGTDPRFASPESTWGYYRDSLKKGEIEAALECHGPWDANYREMYTAIGLEKVRKIGEEMRDIEKITEDEDSAKYRLLRKTSNGQDITFHVYFMKLHGEWKIQQF